MFNHIKRIIVLFLILCFSCENNLEEDYAVINDCSEAEVYYQENIASILLDNCVSCHSTSNSSGGLSLESFNSSIEAIRDGSIMYRINLEPSDPLFMPLGSEKLSQEELKAIQDFSNILCL
tara:strand:+ start:522 stop:884 length:363 start_codon:yes stop_codon:yes gene_type:complete